MDESSIYKLTFEKQKTKTKMVYPTEHDITNSQIVLIQQIIAAFILIFCLYY